jgi:hypothetical protein
MDDTSASADAETGSRASHRANSSVVSTKGFDPARGAFAFGDDHPRNSHDSLSFT